MSSNKKPIAQQRDLAKLPVALAPLLERPQWCVWKWTQRSDGSWQKPPFMAIQPDRHVSTSDPSTWSNYETALATVQAGRADGISYVLTANDPFGAIDLDHCRDLETHSIDIWAQLFLQRAITSYSEVTPSGTGVRIWGLADGEPLHRKFTVKAGPREFEPDKLICAELFRRTNKALRALFVRRNSSAQISLSGSNSRGPALTVNFLCSGSPSAKPQIRTPVPLGVTSLYEVMARRKNSCAQISIECVSRSRQ